MPHTRNPLEQTLSFTPWHVGELTGVYDAFRTVNPLNATDQYVYLAYAERFMRLHREHILPRQVRPVDQTSVIVEIVRRCFSPIDIALGAVNDDHLEMIACIITDVDGIVVEQVQLEAH